MDASTIGIVVIGIGVVAGLYFLLRGRYKSSSGGRKYPGGSGGGRGERDRDEPRVR